MYRRHTRIIKAKLEPTYNQLLLVVMRTNCGILTQWNIIQLYSTTWKNFRKMLNEKRKSQSTKYGLFLQCSKISKTNQYTLKVHIHMWEKVFKKFIGMINLKFKTTVTSGRRQRSRLGQGSANCGSRAKSRPPPVFVQHMN